MIYSESRSCVHARAGLVALLLASTLSLSATAQTPRDHFQSLSEEAAADLVELLGRAEAAETSGQWSVGAAIYREMWTILPAEEYRFREAHCLERLGDDDGAIVVLEALIRSPREDIREAAARRLVPIYTRLAIASAQSAVVQGVDRAVDRSEEARQLTPPPSDNPDEDSIWLPVLLGGFAVAVLGGGIAFGVLSESRAEDARNYDASQPGATYIAVNQLNSDAEDFATVANTCFIVAGALAVTAFLVWLLSNDGADVEGPTPASAWIDGQPFGGLSWSF